MPSPVRDRRLFALALALPMLAGCIDHTNKGSGTGGMGAGAAADASGVSSPTGGTTGTQGTGSTVGPGAGTTNSSRSNPGSTDAAGPENPGNTAR